METKLQVQSTRTGRGVIAKNAVKPDQIIIEITGNIIHWKTLLKIGGVVLDNSYRYDKEHYLSPDGMGNYFNHSCEPNAGVVKKDSKLYLKSIRRIKRGEEITFDYSTIIGADDTWTMNCDCGSSTCRKKVRGCSSLPLKKKTGYLKLGIVPDYIFES